MLPAPPPPAPHEAPLPADAPREQVTPGVADRRWWTPGRTAVVLAGTAVAGCAYIALVDPNHSSLYPQCPFKAMTGWDCPGCGITRALRALMTGHPLRALDHNVLVVVAAVVGLVWYVANRVRARQGRDPLKLTHTRWWTGALIVVIGAFWVTRNIPWGPFAWLGSGASGT